MAQHLPADRFEDHARAALTNTVQRQALRRATDLFGERRRAALRSVDDWEELRRRARGIKDEALAHLDRYLETFVARAEAAGATIHWAPDAPAACALVVGLARARAVRRAVKSKSMTTEEIRLNDALEVAGVETVETDLGEWIIQLADEVPSHIIVPAIHKTRGQIAALFADRIGTPGDADIEALTRAARSVLRGKFAAADLGISGVNFAIAETGTVVIIENEGNARFSTSLPRIHVAVMGIEKVIPRLEDVDVFLRLLPRSGTGQQITSYVSFLTGPGARAGGEGPEELHVVLLDNGRSALLADPVTRQLLACIRCGACLNACPVYQQVGGHAYGSVYPGPIGAVLTPELFGTDHAAPLPFASTLCGACRDVCPVRIDIPDALLHLRSEIKDGGRSAPGVRPAERRTFRRWAWLMSGRRRYEAAARIARWFQPLIVRRGRLGALGRLVARMVPPLAAWAGERDLPPLAPRSFRQLWERQLREPPR